MPKDPRKNINRYKIRGGQLNPFEYQKNQGEVSQHNPASEGFWPADQTSDAELPTDQANAERIKQLLAAHGESVSEPVKRSKTTRAIMAAEAQPESVKTTTADQNRKPRKSVKRAATREDGKQATIRKKVKTGSAQKSVKQLAEGKSVKKSAAQSSGNRTTTRKTAKQAPARKRNAGKAPIQSRKGPGGAAKSSAMHDTDRMVTTKTRANRPRSAGSARRLKP